jgi:hypothetical protein
MLLGCTCQAPDRCCVRFGPLTAIGKEGSERVEQVSSPSASLLRWLDERFHGCSPSGRGRIRGADRWGTPDLGDTWALSRVASNIYIFYRSIPYRHGLS